MRELDLQEHRLTEAVPLSLEERDELARLVPSLMIRPMLGVEGHYILRPGSSVGAVRSGDLSVLIRPKIPMARVMFLVSYALERCWDPAIDQDLAGESSIVEAIVPTFVRMVRRATRRGLLQGYRSEEDALTTVRGRLRFDAQIRDRFGILPPAEVRFDEFTEDVEINRRLNAAAVRLGRLGIRSSKAREKLRSTQALFSRVTLVEYREPDLRPISFDRLNAHYQPAIRLADLILRSSSIDLHRGSERASTFLVDMNLVFETFVHVALMEALGLREGRFPRGARFRNLTLDERGSIGLEPDLSWWESGQCLFVGDVKYKWSVEGNVPNADLYQLLAYTTASNLPGGMLIYARGEREPGLHRVRHAKKDLEIRTLDLSATPEEILGQIETIAERIVAIRS